MPMNEKLDELLIPGQASTLKDKEIVKGMPINYLRGASWRNEIVIADESSQNFTFKELTTLMTRLGEGSKINQFAVILCKAILMVKVDSQTCIHYLTTLKVKNKAFILFISAQKI